MAGHLHSWGLCGERAGGVGGGMAAVDQRRDTRCHGWGVQRLRQGGRQITPADIPCGMALAVFRRDAKITQRGWDKCACMFADKADRS